MGTTSEEPEDQRAKAEVRCLEKDNAILK